jgi:hypothetical protein
MTQTPDDFPGQRNQDSILIVSGAIWPTSSVGVVTYVSGVGFAFNQDDGIALLRSGNFNPTDHEKLQQLVHLADGGPFVGFGTNNYVRDVGPRPFVTASIWWLDATRTKRIVDKYITRNPNSTPATIQWRAYASDGVTVVESMTDRILYNGAFEVTRSRSIP